MWLIATLAWFAALLGRFTAKPLSVSGATFTTVTTLYVVLSVTVGSISRRSFGKEVTKPPVDADLSAAGTSTGDETATS